MSGIVGACATWFSRPNEHACLAARPASLSDDARLVVARVTASAASRPRILLPLIGAWFAILLLAQALFQPDVARVSWPLAVPGIVGCWIASARLRRGALSGDGAWRVTSILSGVQIGTFVVGYFMTGFGAYQSAIVIEILAFTTLDTRIRAMQVKIGLVALCWMLGLIMAPPIEGAMWSVLALIAASTVALIGHHLVMRATYAAEWLRVIDERRADAIAAALDSTAMDLRYRKRAERKLERALIALESAQAKLLEAHKREAIGQLAAGVAHEFNTPTQYVSDNTTFLREAFEELLEMVAARQVEPDPAAIAYLAEQVPRAIEQSLEGLRRISSLVVALKDLSDPTSGIFEPFFTVQPSITASHQETPDAPAEPVGTTITIRIPIPPPRA